jgi:hypothetical protein
LWLVAESSRLGQVFYERASGELLWRLEGGEERLMDGESLLTRVRQRLVTIDSERIAAFERLLSAERAAPTDADKSRELAEFLARELATDLAGPPTAVHLKSARLRGAQLELEGEAREANDVWEIAGEAQWQDEARQFTGYLDAWSASERAAWQAQVEHEARELGFAITMDNDGGAWRLAGSREAMLKWTAQLAEAARDATTAPPGAKPRQICFGGRAMRMEIELGPGWWIDGRTLRIEPQRLGEFAQDLRHRLADAPLGEPITAALVDDPRRPRQAWRFELFVERP